jgi:hypothetical protein
MIGKNKKKFYIAYNTLDCNIKCEKDLVYGDNYFFWGDRFLKRKKRKRKDEPIKPILQRCQGLRSNPKGLTLTERACVIIQDLYSLFY